MRLEAYKLKFPEQVIVESAATDKIRLIAAKEGVRLFSSETQASGIGMMYQTLLSSRAVADLNAAPQIEFILQQILAVKPDWDVVLSPQGTYRLAITQARGGNNALFVMDEAGNKLSLPGDESSDNLDGQRFVRHQETDIEVAVSATINRRNIVVFTVKNNGGFEKYKLLTVGAAAVIVQQAERYALLSKITIDGAVRGQSIFPGQLYHGQLNEDLEPISPAQEKFIHETILEFDAARLDPYLAVWVTTLGGALLLICETAGDELHIVARLTLDYPEPLFSPTLLSDGDELYLAALAGSVGDQARLLVGRYAPQPA